MSVPKELSFGVTRLVALSEVAKGLKMTTRTLASLMRSLVVPIIYMGSEQFVRPSQLDAAMFVMSAAGNPSYAAPGSDFRNRGRPKTSKYPVTTEATPEQSRAATTASTTSAMDDELDRLRTVVSPDREGEEAAPTNDPDAPPAPSLADAIAAAAHAQTSIEGDPDDDDSRGT